MKESLLSPGSYSVFIYDLPNRYPTVERSTLIYIPLGAKVGKVSGMVIFAGQIVLCVQEFLNFELQVIEGYGYEVSSAKCQIDEMPPADEYCKASYPHKDKLYWYDSFPHPHDPTLASTHPHHKHIHPNIAHNRIPAPGLTFTAPNLAFLIEEIQQTLLQY